MQTPQTMPETPPTGWQRIGDTLVNLDALAAFAAKLPKADALLYGRAGW